MTTPNPILADIQSLAPGAILELFILDSSSIAGGGLTYFHCGTNELKQPVVWQGNTYQPFPVKSDGFAQNSNGAMPRPTMTVADINGIIGALVVSLGDLIGSTLTRKRTMAKYLDAVNFANGVNPTADPTAAFTDDIFIVLRKSGHTSEFISFELCAGVDMEGDMIPARQVEASTCWWQYRDGNCPYAGGAVAKIDDTATALLAEDDCSKSIAGCRLRFPQPATLPFGGFPAAGMIR